MPSRSLASCPWRCLGALIHFPFVPLKPSFWLSPDMGTCESNVHLRKECTGCLVVTKSPIGYRNRSWHDGEVCSYDSCWKTFSPAVRICRELTKIDCRNGRSHDGGEVLFFDFHSYRKTSFPFAVALTLCREYHTGPPGLPPPQAPPYLSASHLPFLVIDESHRRFPLLLEFRRRQSYP